MAYFFLALHSPALMPKSPLLNFWNLYLWPLTIRGDCLAGNAAGGKPPPGRPGAPARRHGHWPGFFLGHILLQIAKLLLGVMGLDLWQLIVSKLLILYAFLLPVFWLKFYYIPWAGALSKLSNAGSRLDSLQQTHGLSARELEILRLVLDGKSYKQMEDAYSFRSIPSRATCTTCTASSASRAIASSPISSPPASRKTPRQQPSNRQHRNVLSDQMSRSKACHQCQISLMWTA